MKATCHQRGGHFRVDDSDAALDNRPGDEIHQRVNGCVKDDQEGNTNGRHAPQQELAQRQEMLPERLLILFLGQG